LVGAHIDVIITSAMPKGVDGFDRVEDVCSQRMQPKFFCGHKIAKLGKALRACNKTSSARDWQEARIWGLTHFALLNCLPSYGQIDWLQFSIRSSQDCATNSPPELQNHSSCRMLGSQNGRAEITSFQHWRVTAGGRCGAGRSLKRGSERRGSQIESPFRK